VKSDKQSDFTKLLTTKTTITTTTLTINELKFGSEIVHSMGCE
jgi:hypothetical protein